MGFWHSEEGATLAEMVVALALAAVVALGIIGVFWTSSRAFAYQAEISEIQYMVRISMQKIVNDIREASEISIDGHDLMLNSESGSVLYRYDDNKDQIIRNGVPISEKISMIKFSYRSGMVEVTIQAETNGRVYSLKGAAVCRVGRGFGEG
ncbi:MAG: hypothetical protein ACOX0E_07685 [Syntrophomonadaceae bacterium]|jgi:type II secretory pathway component PulJ